MELGKVFISPFTATWISLKWKRGSNAGRKWGMCQPGGIDRTAVRRGEGKDQDRGGLSQGKQRWKKVEKKGRENKGKW